MRSLTLDEMDIVTGGKKSGGGGGGGGKNTQTVNSKDKVNMDGSKPGTTNIPKTPEPKSWSDYVKSWNCTVTISKEPSVQCSFGNGK